jgi:hypothetical protein
MRRSAGWLAAWPRRLARALRGSKVLPKRISNPRTDLARRELGGLLDRHPLSRVVFGHLALLEHGLKKHGRKALHRLLPDALQLTQQQFNAVGGPQEAPALAELLHEAAARIAPRARPASVESAVSRPLHDFVPSLFEQIDLLEVDAATYLEAMRSWKDSLVHDEQGAATAPESAGAPERSTTLPMAA